MTRMTKKRVWIKCWNQLPIICMFSYSWSNSDLTSAEHPILPLSPRHLPDLILPYLAYLMIIASFLAHSGWNRSFSQYSCNSKTKSMTITNTVVNVSNIPYLDTMVGASFNSLWEGFMVEYSIILCWKCKQYWCFDLCNFQYQENWGLLKGDIKFTAIYKLHKLCQSYVRKITSLWCMANGVDVLHSLLWFIGVATWLCWCWSLSKWGGVFQD